MKQVEVYEMIRTFVGQANILTVPRVLIDFTGDLESALLLSQLIYWQDKGKRADGLIWKTYKQWDYETGLNEYHVRKSCRLLERMGFLTTELHKVGGSPTVHYRLDVEKFSESFLQFLKERNLKNYANTNRDYSSKTTDNRKDSESEKLGKTAIISSRKYEVVN